MSKSLAEADCLSNEGSTGCGGLGFEVEGYPGDLHLARCRGCRHTLFLKREDDKFHRYVLDVSTGRWAEK